MLYIFLFAASSIALYFAQRVETRSRILFWILAYMAIFLLAFIAGCRDNTIGTDVLVYAKNCFQAAKGSVDFWSGFSSVEHQVELVFYAINWISAKTIGHFGIALFLINIIMYAFTLHGMASIRRWVPLWLTMLLFDLTFYNLTLNMMRQGIAVAFTLWSLRFLFQRNLKCLLLSAIVAYFIHKTSIVAYAWYIVIYWISCKSIKTQRRWIAVSFIMGITACATVASIATVLDIGRYSLYLTSSKWEPYLSKSNLLLGVVNLLIFAIARSRDKSNISFYNICILIALADVCSTIVGGLTTAYASRMGYYFNVCTLPLALVALRKTTNTQAATLLQTIVIAFTLTFSCQTNYIYKSNATYPYTSEFLGIE